MTAPHPPTRCLGCLAPLFALALVAQVAAPRAAQPEERPVLGEERTDFSGRWMPVLEEWEGMERLLEIQEASWIYRHALGRVVAAEVITQSPEELRIEIEVLLPVEPQQMRLDGEDHEERTPLGRRAVARHQWEEGVLVHTLRMERSDGTPYTVTVRRSLSEDESTMQLDIRVVLPEDEHRARQVYRRADPEI